MRLAASPTETYKGMVLYNPGGPGGSGVDSIFLNGVQLQAMVGTNYDMVGFDPRGISLAVPFANCSATTPANRRRSMSGFKLPKLTQSYYDNAKAYAQVLGPECAANIGGPDEAGPHMTTRTVVRDLLSIVDAYAQTEDGKRANNPRLLNFLGESYGTFIGQMFATLYPDRVGRVALDGVTSPRDIVSTIGLANIQFMDVVFETFFIYCHAAGPNVCPYYTGNSARDIYNRFQASYVQLDARHAAAQKQTNATVIELALLTLKEGLLSSVYSPIVNYPYVGIALLALEQALQTQNLVAWIAQVDAILASFLDNRRIPPERPEAQIAVRCTDNGGVFFNKTFDDLKPMILALDRQSTIGGETWPINILTCTKWSIKSDDIYLGM